MTPKEKAEKLVEKMAIYHWTDICDYEGAKQCALIAVDEIIQETDTYYDTLIASERKLFLEEVKQEIEKL
jgi:hypothetical protein